MLRAAAGEPWGADAADLLGFPGELMLRLLKMLVLPLVAGSMVVRTPCQKQFVGCLNP